MGEGEVKSEEGKLQRWDYNTHFREYLLLLGNTGETGLETTGNFPTWIGLSETWKGTHVGMRDRTLKDGKERLAVVGFREDRHLVLPVTPALGTEDNIPSSVIYGELHRAKVKAGIVDLLGRAHRLF